MSHSLGAAQYIPDAGFRRSAERIDSPPTPA